MKEITWSYSRINSFVTCPAYWYQHYILKMPEEQNAYATHGLFCHDIMEKHAKGEITQQQALELFENGWYDVEPYFQPFKGYDMQKKTFDKIRPFFDRPSILIGETVSVENRYEHPLPSGEVLGGLIDRLYKDCGDVIISDYKISGVYTKKKTQEQKTQLYLYAYLYFKESGEFPAKIQWIFFKDHTKLVTLDFNEQDMWDAVEWAESNIRRIRGRLNATERFGFKGLFLPNYSGLLSDKTGGRDRHCMELCGLNKTCKFIKDGELMYMTPPKNQDLEIPCKYIKRIGESCTLNNNCKYPNCG